MLGSDNNSLAPGPQHPTALRFDKQEHMYHTWHKWLAAQLYDNEENATKCDKMQHFSENFSDRLPLAIPHLISTKTLS